MTRRQLVISMIIVLLTGLVLPLPVVFAAPPTSIDVPSHQAAGTLDDYHIDLQVRKPGGGWMNNPDTIIRGHWSVDVFYASQINEEVTFEARFWEENGEWDGQQIIGSIDTFKVFLLPGASFVEISDMEWVVEGTLEFHKQGWDPATGRPVLSTFDFPAVITITPSEITIDLERGEPVPIPEWDIWGTTALFDGQEFPPAFLEGNQIIVSSSDHEQPVDDSCFVLHGWMWDQWQSRSLKEQKQLLHQSRFRLWINEERIQMEKLVHWHAVFTTPQGTFDDVVIVCYYVQFDANHFTAGDYQFKGVWEAPYTVTNINEITVTFM